MSRMAWDCKGPDTWCCCHHSGSWAKAHRQLIYGNASGCSGILLHIFQVSLTGVISRAPSDGQTMLKEGQSISHRAFNLEDFIFIPVISKATLKLSSMVCRIEQASHWECVDPMKKELP